MDLGEGLEVIWVSMRWVVRVEVMAMRARSGYSTGRAGELGGGCRGEQEGKLPRIAMRRRWACSDSWRSRSRAGS